MTREQIAKRILELATEIYQEEATEDLVLLDLGGCAEDTEFTAALHDEFHDIATQIETSPGRFKTKPFFDKPGTIEHAIDLIYNHPVNQK
jgi:hypothetical protein